jgi:hypothetical protein
VLQKLGAVQRAGNGDILRAIVSDSAAPPNNHDQDVLNSAQRPLLKTADRPRKLRDNWNNFFTITFSVHSVGANRLLSAGNVLSGEDDQTPPNDRMNRQDLLSYHYKRIIIYRIIRGSCPGGSHFLRAQVLPQYETHPQSIPGRGGGSDATVNAHRPRDIIRVRNARHGDW